MLNQYHVVLEVDPKLRYGPVTERQARPLCDKSDRPFLGFGHRNIKSIQGDRNPKQYSPGQ
jgi:hypothetical protein